MSAGRSGGEGGMGMMLRQRCARRGGVRMRRAGRGRALMVALCGCVLFGGWEEEEFGEDGGAIGWRAPWDVAAFVGVEALVFYIMSS